MGVLQMHFMKLMIKPFELATSCNVCQNAMSKQLLQVFGFIWFIKRKKKRIFSYSYTGKYYSILPDKSLVLKKDFTKAEKGETQDRRILAFRPFIPSFLPSHSLSFSFSLLFFCQVTIFFQNKRGWSRHLQEFCSSACLNSLTQKQELVVGKKSSSLLYSLIFQYG